MKEFTAEKEQTLKEFTDNVYAQGSFFWNYLIKNREIRINGKRASGNARLFPGDKVAYYLTPKQESKPAYRVAYADDDLLIVDKESGVNSEAVFYDLSAKRRCFFVHRLDRNTSGLLAFALTERAERELKKAFAERRAEKIYHALCFGRFERESAVLTAYLAKNAEKSEVRVFDSPRAGAERIVTEYKILKREDGYTLIEVKLHTGKTHQIRAHLSHIGCPVVGDEKYGFPSENRRFNVSRQCLVAKKLTFFFDGGALSYLSGRTFVSRFEAELPRARADGAEDSLSQRGTANDEKKISGGDGQRA